MRGLRGVAVLTTGVAALAVGLFLALGGGDGSGSAPDSAPGPVAPDEGAAPLSLRGGSDEPEEGTAAEPPAGGPGGPGVIRGTVVVAVEDRPVPDAEVRVLAGPGGAPLAVVLTDAEGGFLVEGLAPGDHAVRVYPLENPPAFRTVAVSAVAATRVRIEVPRALGRVVGEVVEKVGSAPVAGAEVFLVSNPRRRSRTGPDGRFAIPGFGAERAAVRVVAAGYLVSSRNVVPTVEGGDVTASFRLRRAAQVHGRVVGPGGEPVPGARVASSGRDARNGPADQWSVTDEAGAFSRDHLRLGARQRLYAFSPGHGLGVSESFRAPRDGLVIRLPPAASISGTIRDGGGIPIVGAEVRASGRPFAGVGDVGPIVAVSDEEGRYTIPDLPAGRYRLVVGSARHAPADAAGGVRVDEGCAVERDFVLGPGGTLAGRVEDEEGRPVAGARVGARGVGVRVRGRTDPIRSEPDGSFRFTGLSPGRYWLTATLEGYQGTRATEETTNTGIVLGLTTRAEIHGRVVLAGSRRPATVFTLEVFRSDTGNRASQRAVFDPDGRFRVRALPPGAYDLVAYADPHWVSRRVEGVETRPGEPAGPVPLVLEQGVRISGKVVYPDGTPVRSADVILLDHTGRASGGPSGTTRTSPSGRFRFARPVPAGIHRIKARRVVREQATVTVNLAAGAEREVEITIQR